MADCPDPTQHPSRLLLDTWHPSISLQTSTNRSQHPIRPLSINGRLPCVPLRVHDVFQAGSLLAPMSNHSSSCQKYARRDVSLSFQATCYALHHAACRLRWQASHQVALPTICVSCLKDDDCSAILYVAIMTAKVNKSSWYRCDKAPDTIKAFLRLKGKKREYSNPFFPKLLKRGHSL